MKLRRIVSVLAVLVSTVAVTAVDPILGGPQALAAPAPDSTGLKSGTIWSHEICAANETCLVGDVSGDGKADAVAFTRSAPGGVWFARSTGTSFEPRQKSSNLVCAVNDSCRLGDVSGDGKADAIAIDHTTQQTKVALSTGTGFADFTVWNTGACRVNGVCHVGDVDGDQDDDLISFPRSQDPSRQDDIWVALSTRTGFAAPTMWHTFFCINAEICTVGDINGDGRTDGIVYKQISGFSEVWVTLAEDNGFGPVRRITQWVCASRDTCMAGDMDGDGKSDLVTFKKSTSHTFEGDVQVARSTGTQFEPPTLWSDFQCVLEQTCALGDVTGDGADDVTIFTHAPQTWVSVSTAIKPPLREMWLGRKITPPVIIAAQPNGGTNTVTWNDNATDEAAYMVLRRTADGGLMTLGNVDSTTTTSTGTGYTFTDRNVTGNSQCYAIVAYNSDLRAAGLSTELCPTLPPLPPPPGPGFGVISTVDTNDDNGVYSSVAIGTDGRGIISHYAGGRFSDLRVAHCIDIPCTAVTTNAVDTAGTTGRFTAIAIGSDGLPVITYVLITHPTNGVVMDLRVAHCNDIRCDSATITTIDPDAEVREAASIAIGADGFPVIVYQDESSTNPFAGMKRIHCLNHACTEHRIHSVSTIRTGDVAVAVGPSGTIYHAIHDVFNFAPRLSLMTCPHADCESFNYPPLVVDTDGGTTPSIAIGRDGLPLISYRGRNAARNETDLMVARCLNILCTTVTKTRLAAMPGASVGVEAKITVGSDGLAIIAHRDLDRGNLEVAHCFDVACNTITSTIVDEFDRQGHTPSIAIGADGLPLVSYMDGASEFLKVAHCSDVACAELLTAPF